MLVLRQDMRGDRLVLLQDMKGGLLVRSYHLKKQSNRLGVSQFWHKHDG
jgi:hypothetical protein